MNCPTFVLIATCSKLTLTSTIGAFTALSTDALIEETVLSMVLEKGHINRYNKMQLIFLLY